MIFSVEIGVRSLDSIFRSQRIEYSYDSYQRVTQIRRYTSCTTEDVCQQVNFYYDINPFDAAYSSGTWGRVAAAQYFVPTGSTCKNGSNRTVGNRFTEFYKYTNGGLITGKKLLFFTDTTWPTYSASIPAGAYSRDLSYSWNGLGQQTSVTYPGGLIWNSQTSSYDNVSSGKTYNYQYDTMLRPSGLTDGGSNVLIQTVTYGAADELCKQSCKTDPVAIMKN